MSAIDHGGRLDEAIASFGGERRDWLDLSTGINPRALPLPPLKAEIWTRLPGEQGERQLNRAARDLYGVGDDHEIVAANGTQAIIQALPQVLDCRSIAIVSPTYGEHFHCWNKSGADVVEVASLEAALHAHDCVVIGNPNNPDCRVHKPDTLVRVASQLAERGVY